MKNRILQYIRTNKKVSQSQIGSVLGINYYVLIKLLEEMEKDNLIIKSEENKGTYWEIKNARNKS